MFSKCSVSFRFPYQNLVHISVVTHTCHVHSTLHPSLTWPLSAYLIKTTNHELAHYAVLCSVLALLSRSIYLDDNLYFSALKVSVFTFHV